MEQTSRGGGEPERPAPQAAPAAKVRPPSPPDAERPGREAAAPESPPPPPGSRLLIAVLAILAAAELGGVIYFYTRFYTQSLVATSLQGKLDESAAAVKAQGAEIARQSDLLAGIRREYLKADEERRELKKGIAERQRAISDLEVRLKAAAESAAETKATLARQEQIAAYLRVRLKESKGTELQLMDRLEAAAKEKADLEAKLARAREGEFDLDAPSADGGIPLRETVVSEAAGAPNEISGQVLVSHDKYNFVIVNLGSEDGVSVGDEGSIEQKGVEVGKAKVKKLYPRMCLADVVAASPDRKIEKNFVVKFVRHPRRGDG